MIKPFIYDPHNKTEFVWSGHTIYLEPTLWGPGDDWDVTLAIFFNGESIEYFDDFDDFEISSNQEAFRDLVKLHFGHGVLTPMPVSKLFCELLEQILVKHLAEVSNG